MALTDQVSLLLMLEARDKASTILSQVGNALQSLSQRSAAAGADAAVGVEKLEAAQVRAEAESRAYQRALDEQALAQERLKVVTEAAASGSIEAAAMEDAALTRVAAADTAVAERSTAMAAAQKEAAGASELASSRLTGVGVAAGAVALAVGYVADKSIAAAGDFQASMTKLVTSAGESKDTIDQVSAAILKLAVDSGTSTKQLADGWYIASSAGFTFAKGGLQVVTAAAEGAKAENADLKTVTDAVTSTLVDYHMKADQAAQTTSKLVAAVGAGKANFGDFTGALHSVLPVASAAKISLDDILGAMASMTVHGMSADQAAQNMADAIRHLQNPTQLQTKYLAQLGITAGDLSNDLSTKGLTGTINEVVNAIGAHMGPAGKVMVSAFNESKTAASDAQRMISQMPPAIQGMATAFLNGQVSVSQWRTQLKGLPVDQANLLTQFASLANRAHGFSDALKSGQPDALAFSAALNKAMGDATGLNVALMIGGENAGYTANAIRQVAGAATEAGGHVKGWAEIQSTYNQQLARLKETAETAKISLGSGLLPIMTKLAGVVVAILGPIAQFAAEHQTLAATIVVVVGAVAGLLTAFVIAVSAFKALGESIKFVSEAMEGFDIASAANPIMLAIMAIALIAILIITHWSTVKAWLATFWGWMVTAAEAVAHGFVAAWQWVVGALGAVWSWIKSAAMFLIMPLIVAWNMISSVTMTVWNAIAAFFKKWWPLLLAIFMPFVFAVIALWNNFHTQIENFAIAVWNGIKDFLVAVWDEIKSVASTVWDLIQKYVILPNQILWAELKSLWDTLMSWLSSIWSSIASRAASAWNLVRTYVINPLQAMYNTVVSIFNNVKNAIENAINATLSWLGGIGSRFVTVGEAIVHGIISGIGSAAGALFSSLYSLASSALGAAKSAIQHGSPSRLFAREIGEPITQGIAMGVLNAHPVLISAMQATTDTALSAAGRGFGVPGAGGGLALASAPSGAVAGGGGGMQVVIDLRGTQFFAPKQVDDLLDVLGKRFVQQILPAAGVQIRR